MTILFLDQFSDPGGAQRCLLDLLPAVRERGWRATVALPGSGKVFGQIEELGFETARIDCGPYTSGAKSIPDAARFARDVPRLAGQIRRLADAVKPDLLYINGPRLLPAAAWARLPAPALFHSHSLVPPGLGRRLCAWSLARLRATVITACRFVAEPWRSAVDPARMRVVYNGVPAGVRRQGPRPAGTDWRIGCIGRIAPEKGQREFLAAASIIHHRLPHSRFLIYGAPLFRDLAAEHYCAGLKAAATGLPVEFRGWTSNVQAALAELDLLLVPSAPNEATTRVILEAFAAGVPVVAFRSGGIPEVVEDGRNGCLTGSAAGMAECALRLLAAGAFRLADMAEAARDSWRRRFTLERYRQQVIQAIAGLTVL